MTDYEAVGVLGALAGVPYPWLQPGVPALHYYDGHLASYCVCRGRGDDTVCVLFTHDYRPGVGWQARGAAGQVQWTIHFPRDAHSQSNDYRPCPPGEGPYP